MYTLKKDKALICIHDHVIWNQQSGFSHLLKEAKKGYPESQCLLGEMYFKGEGIPKNYAEALNWFKLAAQQGHDAAQCYLGIMYHEGWGVKQNYSTAMQWYKAAAEQENSSALNNIGSMYQNGEGVQQDLAEAVEWYKLAAKQGDSFAQKNLGYMYYNGEGVQQSYKKALKWFESAAEGGEKAAQYMLGHMYEFGEGVQQDIDEAIEWYKASAKQEYVEAINALGLIYLEGYGVKKDYKMAIKWFSAAANQGDPEAQNILGFMYENGEGVNQSYTEAVKWYKLSADQEFAVAQYNLGQMYSGGLGVKQNFEEAFKWYKKAAEQEDEDAQFNLGELYREGKGVQKNESEAIKWYELSANQGHEGAQEILESLYPDEEYTLNLDDETEEENQEKDQNIPTVRLSDIAGLDEAKKALEEKVILPLKHKSIYEKYGKSTGGGILLFGLPGTGKTMFAQAVATELKAKFFSVRCSDIESKWVGESERNVKQLFEEAKKCSKAVIFFDEFDSIGRRRSSSEDYFGPNTVQEILTQMQGVEKSPNMLLVLAATNAPWSLDGALLRPGRFSEKIYIPLPDKEARTFILKRGLSAIKLVPEIKIENIADRLDGCNGADVAEFCEKIKMIMIRKEISRVKDPIITVDDLESILSTTKSSVLSRDVERMNEFLEELE